MRARTAIALLIGLIVAAAQPAVAATVSYQGELQQNGLNYDGNARFKFVILSGGVSLWSNDGTSAGGSQPAASVLLPVENGIFSVLLGEPPMVPVSADDLGSAVPLALRVWVSTGGAFEQLADQPIAAAVEALRTDNARRALDGFTVESGNLLSDGGYIIQNTGAGNVQLIYPPTGDGWEFATSGQGSDLWLREETAVGVAGEESDAEDPGDRAFVTRVAFEEGGNVGIGTTSPTQKLDVAGAIEIGTTATSTAGAIRWTGSDFQGYDGSTWVSLTGSSAGSSASFFAYNSGDDPLASSIWTTAVCNIELHDEGGNHNTATGVYTVPSAGIYSFSGSIGLNNVADATRYALAFWVNGSRFAEISSGYTNTTGNWQVEAGSMTADLNAGDTVEIRAFLIGGGDIIGSSRYTTFSGHRVASSAEAFANPVPAPVLDPEDVTAQK